MQRKFIEKVLASLDIFVLFSIPIIVFPHQIFAFNTSKSFFFMGLAEVCFFLWIYFLATMPEYRLTKKQLIIFCVPALFLLSLTISGMLAPSRNLAFWSSFERGTGLIFLYHCLAFGLVVASLVKVRGKTFAQKIYYAIFFSGIILAISALFNDTGGLAGNSSYTGAYLIFSFFIGGILLFVVRNVWRKILVSIGLIIILVIPFVIGARGAFGGLLAGILVAFFIYLALSGKKIIRVTGVTLLILSLVLTAFVGISLIQPTSRIHSEFEKAAGNSRFIFWKIALEGIKERPLLGWGPENYSVVYAKYFDPTILEPGEAREVSVDKPHNMVLEQFVSGGFIGGMLFLLFLILFFILPLYFYRKKIFSKMELALFTGLFFAYFLQDLIIFDTVITYMTLFVLFGIFTGTTLIFTQKEKIKTISGLKPIARTVHAIVCILLFIFSWIFFVHLPSKKAKGIYTLVSRKTAEKDFSVVASISPMGNGRDVGIIGERMVKSYQENIDTIKQDPRLIAQAHTDINSFLTEADKLTEAAPNDYALWLACAQLESFDMTSTGNFEDKAISRALSYIDRARELSPNDPRVYLVYGQIFAYQKEFAKAHDYLMKAYNLDPKIPVLKEYLDKFEKLFGTKL